MLRLLVNLLAALSLLISLAFATLWVRSHYIRDLYIFSVNGGDVHAVQSILGRLHVKTDFLPPGARSIGAAQHNADRLAPNAIWNGALSGYPARAEWRAGGFIVQTYTRSQMNFLMMAAPIVTRHRLIVVPYWALTTLFAALPGCWLFHRLLLRRRAPGLCGKCGYDLRASTEKCPECGTPVPNEAGGCHLSGFEIPG